MRSHVETMASRTFGCVISAFCIFNIAVIIAAALTTPLSISVTNVSAWGCPEGYLVFSAPNCTGVDLAEATSPTFSFRTPDLVPLNAELRILARVTNHRYDMAGWETHANISVDVATSDGFIIYHQLYLRYIVATEGQPYAHRMVLFDKTGVAGVYTISVRFSDLPDLVRPLIGDVLFDIEVVPPAFSLFQMVARAALASASLLALCFFIIAIVRALRRDASLTKARSAFEAPDAVPPNFSVLEALRASPNSLYVAGLLVGSILLVNPAYALSFFLGNGAIAVAGSFFLALFFYLVLLHFPYLFGSFLLVRKSRRSRLWYYVPRVVLATLFFVLNSWAVMWHERLLFPSVVWQLRSPVCFPSPRPG